MKKEDSYDKEEVGLARYLVLGIVVLILIVSVVQSFQINAIKSGTIDAYAITKTDSSYDQMMREMHPEQYAGNQENQMVGGC
ncbi:MAG TPA: hypothetical protein VJH90_03625 [archaeon]|nr:hypothetical protein [archaeon]